MNPLFFQLFSIWHTFRTHGAANFRPMSSRKIVIYAPRRSEATLIAAILHGLHARIVCCSTAEQVIASCRQEQADVLIVTTVTPFLDGSEFLSQVRRKGEQMPAIYVISWQQSEQIVLSLLECGVDQYLTFPICMNRLRMKAQAQLNDLAQR